MLTNRGTLKGGKWYNSHLAKAKSFLLKKHSVLKQPYLYAQTRSAFVGRIMGSFC